MLFQGMPAPNMHLTKFVDFRKLRMEHNENLVTIQQASKILKIGAPKIDKAINDGFIQVAKFKSGFQYIDLNSIDRKTLFLLRIPIGFRNIAFKKMRSQS